MRRTHLVVQATIVLTMVTFVSWPQFRPARTQSVWRYAPAAVLQARTNDAARFAGEATAAGQRPNIVVEDSAFTTAASQNSLAQSHDGPAYSTSAAVAAVGAKLNALLGFARTSLNVPIPYARVVLRNIRTGQVLARTVANAQGQFSFLDIEANAYIVELVGPDGSVVAASPMVTMSRGDVRMTEIRVAAAATTVSASFSDTMTTTFPQAMTVAASNDVTRTTSTTTPQESTR